MAHKRTISLLITFKEAKYLMYGYNNRRSITSFCVGCGLTHFTHALHGHLMVNGKGK